MHISVKKFVERTDGKNFEEFPNERAYYAYNIFFVDDTAVAWLGEDVHGNRALILSAEALSPRITPYLPELEALSRVNPKNVYKIPQQRFKHPLHHTFDDLGVYKIFAEKLDKLLDEFYDSEGGRTVYRCQQYLKWMGVYDNLRTNIMPGLKEEEKWVKGEKDVTEYMGKVAESVQDFMNNHTYKELVDIAFFKGECDEVDEDFRELLRSAMNTSGDMAFLKVFDDGNTYSPDKTPEGEYRLVMNNEDSYNLGQTFLDGNLKHGMKFGNFTIMSKRHGYVQISCNKYSPEMIKVVHDDAEKYRNEHL